MRYYSFLFALLGIFGAVWISAETKKFPSQVPNDKFRGTNVTEENQSASTNGDLDVSETTASAENGFFDDKGNKEITVNSSRQPPADTSDSGIQPSIPEPNSNSSSKTRNSSIFPSPFNNGKTDLGCEKFTLTEENGEISSNYVNEDKCVEWFIDYGEGYNVTLTLHSLDLDSAAGDFLLIRADKSQPASETTPVFTGKLARKTFQVLNTGKAYILFVTHWSASGKQQNGFQITYSRSGKLTTPSISTRRQNSIPRVDNTHIITVYIADVTAKDFHESHQVNFTTALANWTDAFCKKKNITQETVRSENVVISLVIECPRPWPNYETCVEINLAIPVNTTGKEYQLNRTNLQTLWDTWDEDARKHSGYSFKKYTPPNYKKQILIWVLPLVVLIIILSVILLYLWRCQQTSEHKEDPKVSTGSIYDVPPIFDDMDDKLDDPEFLSKDSLYYLHSETSTDDLRYSYGTLPEYNDGQPFQFNKSTKGGYDNHTFIEDDDEYEIMNRNSLRNTVEEDKKNREYQDQKDPSTIENRTSTGTNGSKSIHYYEIPSTVEEATL